MVARQRGNETALDRAEKKREVIELRRKGVTFDDISVITGIGRSTAHNWVKTELQAKAAELSREVGELRVESMSRLEALLEACWPKAMLGSHQHIAEARRIISDLSDLTGAKAPVKFELGAGDVDRALAEAQRILDERAAAIDAEVVPAQIEAG